MLACDWIYLVLLLIILHYTFINAYYESILILATVQTLQTISTKLQNTYWNISRTSCSQSQGLNNTILSDDILSNVTCDCSFNNSTICHVTSMYDHVFLSFWYKNMCLYIHTILSDDILSMRFMWTKHKK